MSRCKQSSYWEFYPFSLKRRNNRDVHRKKYGKDLKRSFELSGFWQRPSLIKIELLVEFGDGIKILLRLSQQSDEQRSPPNHDVMMRRMMRRIMMTMMVITIVLWWCKQAPGEVTTGKMTARCIKITADNSEPSSYDQEFLQCHQDLPIALSLSVLSNIALFSLTISLILFPGLLSMFGCFVHFLTLWSLRSQRRGQEVGEMFWVSGTRQDLCTYSASRLL